MNEMFDPNRGDREAVAVQSTISALTLPDFIVGFDIRFGEFDGDPAVWVIFKTNVDDRIDGAALDDHVRSRLAVRDAVTTALYQLDGSRAPFVKFQHA